MQETINTALTEYLGLYPDERAILGGLLSLMQPGGNKNPTSDTNFDGHVTGSMFVLTSDRRVLLLEHRRLGKFLQPGGHIDHADASPFEAALRELAEETGIKNGMTHLLVSSPNRHVPMYIEVQHITASVRYNEPAHNHYDFQYLTLLNSQPLIKIDTNESKHFEWIEWKEFCKITQFEAQAARIDALLNTSP